METRQRLEALRSLMAERSIDAYIVPSSDPHQSEYPPDHWKHREWMAGFVASAGTLVVTSTTAGLWTDFRYFLAAETALAGSGIELFRVGEPDVPDYPDWLAAELEPGARVGYDELCLSLAAARTLDAALASRGIETAPGEDLVAMVRVDRPALPVEPLAVHDVRFAGESRGEKISALRTGMERLGADYHVLCTLDDIAWLLNVRGNDVPYNPVTLAHLLVGPESVTLFVDETKLAPEVRTELESDGVTIEPYDAAAAALSDIPAGSAMIVSPSQVSIGFVRRLDAGVRIVEHVNLTTEAKARKNPVELEHLRSVMARDGVAMVRFLHWLATTVGQHEVTELTAEQKLLEFRSLGERFVSESFRTISAYRGHGAIVHYAATPQTSSRLQQAGLYLLDSGGQYQDGTTDITRTVALGEPGVQERRDFTIVLKGHIGLATLTFPVGTTGHMIDAVCREHLWRERMNYGHGTGHGVGFFLNVHEGPQRISQHPNEVALRPGMVVSNEPGLYRAELYGVRMENLVAVVEDGKSEFGSFLRFETLTLCPIDRSLIDPELLNQSEREWVDEYHRTVRDRLLGHLEGPVAEWLDEACAPL